MDRYIFRCQTFDIKLNIAGIMDRSKWQILKKKILNRQFWPKFWHLRVTLDHFWNEISRPTRKWQFWGLKMYSLPSKWTKTYFWVFFGPKSGYISKSCRLISLKITTRIVRINTILAPQKSESLGACVQIEPKYTFKSFLRMSSREHSHTSCDFLILNHFSFSHSV